MYVSTYLNCAFQKSEYVCMYFLGIYTFTSTFCILGTNSGGNNYRAYSDGGYAYSNKGSSGNTTSTYYVSTYIFSKPSYFVLTVRTVNEVQGGLVSSWF